MKSGRKVRDTKSIRGEDLFLGANRSEDLFFLKITMILGKKEKDEKDEIKVLFLF